MIDKYDITPGESTDLYETSVPSSSIVNELADFISSGVLYQGPFHIDIEGSDYLTQMEDILDTAHSYGVGFQLFELGAGLERLNFRISELSSALWEIRDYLKKEIIEEIQSRPLVSSFIINDLGSDHYEVLMPIPVIIEEGDEEAIVRWPDLDAFGRGDTLGEALIQLKKDIISLYADLEGGDLGELGPPALRMRNTLKRYIREI